MNYFIPEDPQIRVILCSIFGILILASVIGALLSRSAKSDTAKSVIANLNARTRAWWFMAFFVTAAILSGRLGATLLFMLISFFALREFITLTPTHRSDHRTLFWAFFIITPLHYFFVWDQWYGAFSIFIPVYGCLVMPIRNALSGETEAYLSRTAKVQWALMVCVYFISHAPALLNLTIRGYEGENIKLLLYLMHDGQDRLHLFFGSSIFPSGPLLLCCLNNIISVNVRKYYRRPTEPCNEVQTA